MSEVFRCRDQQLYLKGVNETPAGPGVTRLEFLTTRGSFTGIYHHVPDATRAVLFLSGSHQSMDGPAGLYSDLAQDLRPHGVASLVVGYRVPGDCIQCALDALVALRYLDDEGVADAAAVGWSFGGSVAISVASVAKIVRSVAAISTHAVACRCVRRLHSKPMLLLHGDSDREAALSVVRRIHSEAVGPRRLIIYANTGHALTEAREQARRDLTNWLLETLRVSPPDKTCRSSPA